MASPTANSVGVSQVYMLSSLNLGAATALIYGYKWGGVFDTNVGLTWSVPQGTAYFSQNYSYDNEWDSWYALNSIEIAGVTRAMQAWTDVSGLTATRVSDTSSVVGELRFAKTSKIDWDSSAHAYFPSSSPAGGDVWLGVNDWNTSGFAANTPGSFDYLTLLHEIGHALGLKHPFTASSYNTKTMSSSYDSYFYTVMSYSAKPGNASVGANFYPTTPMYLDLVAIQHLYGRDTTVKAGNTAYTFAAGQRYWQTIDDSGGSDSISYVGSLSCRIDLRPGKFSILSDPINFSDGTSTRSTVCIGPNTIIETAVGGSGSDVLIGNTAKNALKGGRGADKLYGREGHDKLIGSYDNDYLSGGAGSDSFYFSTALSTTSVSNVDRIADFNVKDDRICLDDAIFRGLKKGTLASAAFKIGSRAYDSNDKIIYNKSTGDLFYDPDGTGAAGQIKFATLAKGLYLTNADFVIY